VQIEAKMVPYTNHTSPGSKLVGQSILSGRNHPALSWTGSTDM